jgi:leader peptidase (prepilin peptidase)/N-methyltransferase
VQLLVRGRIDEPAAVQAERAEMAAALAALPAAERAVAEREWQADPLATPPGEGWGKARIAFGPFLVLATLEVLLLGPERIMEWLVG